MKQLSPNARTRMNLDTDFLKLIAIFSMTCDHVGKKLLPELVFLQIIGRLAFPLFAYCIVVGCLYTHDVKRYLLRLGVFALISQPFYVLMTYPTLPGFLENLTNWNIMFTLFIGVCTVYGIRARRWWLSAAAVLAVLLFNFDYGINGILVMLVFYLFRTRPAVCGAVAGAFLMAVGLSGGGAQLQLGTYPLSIQVFAALAVPLVCVRMNTGVKCSRWLFYAYYPAHMAAIFLLRLWLRV